MADWIQVASDVLFNLTRRRWPGATTVTIRPMSNPGPAGGAPATVGVDGVSEIVLPNPPVVSISQILIDGSVVASSLYRVDDWRRLVYIPTVGVTRSAWPASQDLDAPTSAAGTFAVTYVHGTPPPAGGVKACAELATMLGIGASPKLAGQARLPDRMSSVSRQGVSAQVADPSTMFTDGQTGIPAVDLWVASVNFGAKQRRGRVYRLGSRRSRRTTAP